MSNGTQINVVTNTVEIRNIHNRIDIVAPNTGTTIAVTQPTTRVVQVNVPGQQGVQGESGASADVTALNTFTSSIQTQVNSLTAATSSYVLNAVTASMTVLSSSFASTASFISPTFISASAAASGFGSTPAETDPVFTARSASLATTGSNTFRGNQGISGSIYLRSGSVIDSTGADIIIKAGVGFNAGIALYNNSFTQYLAVDDTGSYANKFTAAVSVTAPAFTGSLYGTASWASTASLSITSSYYAETDPVFVAISASLATTGSNTFKGDQIITGSLTITNNFTVLGSASIQYISESTLNIGTNLITVNTFNPGVRFGGLAVIDSGSSPSVSASFLYDSLQDEFIFVHKGDGTNITSSHFVLGPETYNNLGDEIYLSANRIPKGVGNEHLNDSNISDNGSLVSINSNTNITGSLLLTGSRFIVSSSVLQMPQYIDISGSTRRLLSGTITAVDWSNRTLNDDNGAESVAWNDRRLSATEGNVSIDWDARSLRDSYDNISINWDARKLYDGATAEVTDYSGAVKTLHYRFNDTTYVGQVLEDFSNTFTYAGQVLQTQTLYTPGNEDNVQLYDLVWLRVNDKTWYKVTNKSANDTDARKLLGIVVVDNEDGTGDVMIRGNIVVSYDGSGDGPDIRYYGQPLTLGLPIYASNTNDFSIGSMSSEVQKSMIMRVLGYTHYQNVNTNTRNHILYFNPSNDYYSLS